MAKEETEKACFNIHVATAASAADGINVFFKACSAHLLAVEASLGAL